MANFKVFVVLVCAIACAKSEDYSVEQESAVLDPESKPSHLNRASILKSNLPEEEQIAIANKIQEVFDAIDDDDDRSEAIYAFLRQYKPGYKFTVLIGYKQILYYTKNFHLKLKVNEENVFISGPDHIFYN